MTQWSGWLVLGVLATSLATSPAAGDTGPAATDTAVAGSGGRTADSAKAGNVKGGQKNGSSTPIAPCALKRLPKPAEAKVEGCAQAACVTAAPGARLCRCLGDEVNGIVLERDGKVQPALSLSAFMTGVDDFEVLTGDLDGRPGDEWVIANHDTTSNGMGVAFWTVAVADSIDRLNTAVTWMVEDYGPGNFAKPRSGAGCDVLATEWNSGSEPKRGPGLYLYGRWYRYLEGRLEPLADRPIVSRRFLEGFAQERDGAGEPDGRGQPARWLSKKSRMHEGDPAVQKLIEPGVRGRVAAIDAQKNEEGQTTTRITVEAADSTRTVFVLRTFAPAEEDPTPYIERFGDWTSRRLLPRDYTPASLGAWLSGRMVRVVPAEDAGQSQIRVLWLE